MLHELGYEYWVKVQVEGLGFPTLKSFSGSLAMCPKLGMDI